MRFRPALLLTLLSLGLLVGPASARDWYVSINRGRGKKGSKKRPAKDLGNILKKLEPGDRIFMAEGEYPSRGERGYDEIRVPVEIYGGYSDDFSERDPWGAHRTVLTGDNKSDNYQFLYRLKIILDKWKDHETWIGKGRYDEPYHRIVVDGIIVDNAKRNRYADPAKGHKILRMANPKTGENATPGTGGISVVPWKGGDAIVRNCVVINTAPSEGVIALWGNKNSRMLAENNLVVNNTGNGIQLLTSWHPREDGTQPKFIIRHNTSLFNEKYGPPANYGGAGMKSESDCVVLAYENVFGFNDQWGYENNKSKGVIFNNNLVFGSLQADYWENGLKMILDEIEDESDLLDWAEGNISKAPEVPIPERWGKLWQGRSVIDRNAAEADVKAGATPANELRSMLGMNLQGGTVETMGSDVWLPRIELEEALPMGTSQYGGKGSKKPPAGGGDAPNLPDLKKVFEEFDE